MTHKNLSLGKCWKLFLASLTTKLQNRGKIWTGYLAEEMQRKTRTKKSHKESTLEVDSSVPLTHHDPRDLELICFVKKIRFRTLSI